MNNGKSDLLKSIENERPMTREDKWDWFLRYTEEFHKCFPSCGECRFYLPVTKHCNRLNTTKKPNETCTKGER